VKGSRACIARSSAWWIRSRSPGRVIGLNGRA
jgi:hypothetical protein